jgi:hypothetical protein
MKRLALVTGLSLALAVLAACGPEPTPTPSVACPTEPPTSVSAQATVEDAALATVMVSGAVEGEFAIELYGDRAPLATANFVALARCGFYDGIWFHRVLSGFVIQAGDPQTKSRSGDFEGLGTGGPGYEFEIGLDGERHPHERQPVLHRAERPERRLDADVHDLRPGHLGHRCRRRHRGGPGQ